MYLVLFMFYEGFQKNLVLGLVLNPLCRSQQALVEGSDFFILSDFPSSDSGFSLHSSCPNLVSASLAPVRDTAPWRDQWHR